ncbi:MAG: LysR family transcriptional regulator Bucepa02002399 [uncultured Paraburkholderia sp.]|nr:MAG: LysR family transcriptional regulator Bucepa02002399 [uncultured Paraburkholderia sp.]CAH2912706.1 MAG: LysR family transcriptional regulator Bucepa02002399 [uncultured Paraburkholderia sp.]
MKRRLAGGNRSTGQKLAYRKQAGDSGPDRIPFLSSSRELEIAAQFAYCAKGHSLFACAGDVTPEQAAAHEWAWRSYPLPEAEGSQAPRNITAVADNMEAVAMLVLSGPHLGYLPGHFAAPFVEQGLLAALNPARMRYRVAFHMVARARQHRTDIVEAFLEDMKAAHAAHADQ